MENINTLFTIYVVLTPLIMLMATVIIFATPVHINLSVNPLIVLFMVAIWPITLIVLCVWIVKQTVLLYRKMMSI